MTEPNETFRVEQIEWCETVKPVVPLIIEEAKEEEMAANMQVRFFEWQHKWLSEAIEFRSSLKKKDGRQWLVLQACCQCFTDTNSSISISY